MISAPDSDMSAASSLTNIRKRQLPMMSIRSCKPVSPVKLNNEKESSVLDALLIMRQKEDELKLDDLNKEVKNVAVVVVENDEVDMGITQLKRQRTC